MSSWTSQSGNVHTAYTCSSGRIVVDQYYRNFHRIVKPWAQPCDDVKAANQSEESQIPQRAYWLWKQIRDRGGVCLQGERVRSEPRGILVLASDSDSHSQPDCEFYTKSSLEPMPSQSQVIAPILSHTVTIYKMITYWSVKMLKRDYSFYDTAPSTISVPATNTLSIASTCLGCIGADTYTTKTNHLSKY
jgi:hypothetical protein